jgi:hypothetical protein
MHIRHENSIFSAKIELYVKIWPIGATHRRAASILFCDR